MVMTHVALTVVGCAMVVLLVGMAVTARRRRLGVFRREDYIRI